MLGRVARNLAIVSVVLAVGAWLWAPDRPRLMGGILGGGALAGLAFWVLAGVVNAVARRAEIGEKRPIFRGFALVNFFTRHAILAFVAYVMMVRLHLDPIGMLVGVTAVVVAAAIEAARPQ